MSVTPPPTRNARAVLRARAKVTEVDGAESDCRDGAEHIRRPGRSGVCRRLRDRPGDAARRGQNALPGSARARPGPAPPAVRGAGHERGPRGTEPCSGAGRPVDPGLLPLLDEAGSVAPL